MINGEIIVKDGKLLTLDVQVQIKSSPMLPFILTHTQRAARLADAVAYGSNNNKYAYGGNSVQEAFA